MRGEDTTSAASEPAKVERDRRDRVRVVYRAEAGRSAGRTVRATAAAEGVPTSTAYRWLACKAGSDATQGEQAFYNSPDGLEALHRIVTSLHLVFVQAAGCGVDRLCQFLALSQLDRFVAASHGNQHGVAAKMEGLLGEYGDLQRRRLGAKMGPRSIVVAEDETFHPAICLVAMDAESGLILVEKYSERRDAATWGQALDEALDGLPVSVTQVVGDEAKGLIAHARDGLGVPHASDLFHVQHDLSKATSLSLRARVDRLHKALAAAEERTARWRDAKAAYWRGPRPPGRPMQFDRLISEAEAAEATARLDVETGIEDQIKARQAMRDVGHAYHPFDLSTGAPRGADAVRALFASAMTTSDEVAVRANLSERCLERIDKARRVLGKLAASVAFFHGQLDRTLAELDLAPAVLATVRTQLVPGPVSGPCSPAAPARPTERAAIRAVRPDLVRPGLRLDQPVHAPRPALSSPHSAGRRQLCCPVRPLVGLRRGPKRPVGSSSPWQACTGLSDRRLKALTVIHAISTSRRS